MKNNLLKILLLFSCWVQAQVTEILVSDDCYIASGTSLAFGASVPFYQKGGFLYTIASDSNVSEGAGKLFKINQGTNQVTEIQAAVPVRFASNSDIPFYVGAYQDKLFFLNVSGWCGMIDTTSNTFVAEYFPIYNQTGYQGLVVYGNQIINGTGLRKNIDNGVETYTPTYFDENGAELAFASILFKEIDNRLLSLWYGFNPNVGVFGTFKILQDNGVGFSSFYSSPQETINTLLGNQQNFIKLNDRLIYFRQAAELPYNTKLISSPMVNGDIFILESGSGSYIDLFAFQNELYYYQQGTSTIKKTNGYAVSDFTGLTDSPESYLNPSFSASGNPYNSFIEFNGQVYFNKNVGNQVFLVRYDGVQETPLAALTVQHAIVQNGKLYFSGNNAEGWGIFSYDGLQLQKLDLGTLSGQTWGNTSLFGYNHFLFFSQGTALVKIDLDSVLLTTPTLDASVSVPLSVYPNPAKDKIYFSSSVKQVEIFDLGGKQFPLPLYQNQMEVSSLKNGFYFLKITDTQGQTFTQKLIKE